MDDDPHSTTTVGPLDIGEEDFAATRPPDDAFDIDPITSPKVPTGPRASNANRGRGRGRGSNGPGRRGRGGRGGAEVNPGFNAAARSINPIGNTSGLSGSRYATVEPAVAPEVVPAQQDSIPAEDQAQVEVPSQTAIEPEEGPAETQEPAQDVAEADGSATAPVDQEEFPAETSQAAEPVEKRPEYPKRDRIATGGLKKPKLTESELAERMEAIKLKNQSRTERHQRAAEDEEAFKEAEQARKAIDTQTRVQTRKKKAETDKRRKELDAEREQNRQRKLNAVSNREWDNTKTEEDYNPGGYNPRYRKTAHGGTTGIISSPSASYSRNTDSQDDNEFASNYDDEGDNGAYRGRGRNRGRGRGRGGRGGRGGGGGGFVPRDGHQSHTDTPANIHSETDFPALAPVSKDANEGKSQEDSATAAGDGSMDKVEGGTWADQAQEAASHT